MLMMLEQHLYKSPTIEVNGFLQVSITLTYGALLIFFQSEVKKLLVWLAIEPTTLDLGSKSGVVDLSDTTSPLS